MAPKLLDHNYKLYHDFFTEAIFGTLATVLTGECLDLADCYSRLILRLAETTQRKCMDLADCYSRTLRVSVVNVLFCLCFVCVCSGEICRSCKIMPYTHGICTMVVFLRHM